MIHPPLTTERQPKDAMARVAVEMLIAANRTDAPAVPDSARHRVLPYELVVRDSTGVAKPAST